ncbi:bile acid-CoA:amino acid N-acyltransferase [Rhinatrema bivittatum]|uniref:bile acid-CoA:amino acid N-acyltransferase n=1 Tax=Rhinatrema bivittatum TaxID=194408 RepID=UPI00112E7A93|nr:bile acid-CoA:amino acid N-acyltransferase [Rhinatrema bivittatum]XP_029430759.1 bile acid-CoA:amino acid N-acyltransferase [Rhinatrema bivittatum]XP_029430760.1 bile acid-CoA:amino acid N-acyltransferase [Rhinatrema bivittatum]XP_029430761.1 bile acid-CoA:amino acid N-acyltransferase [Rhinatrema bivittatum]
MVQFTVTPEVSLADEPLRIQVSGLAPLQIVTLRASLTDEKGVGFQSRAFYRSNEAGEVNLERDAATGGDYSGAQPMGLLCSLKPEKMFHRLMKRELMHSPLHVKLDLYDMYQLFSAPDVLPVASRIVERWYVAPGVQRVLIREGRVRGALFLPPGKGPFPGVIDMFGGIGGLIEFRGGLLASHGFVALSLAYFAYDDLPKMLDEIDLEYFEEAVDLLMRHPKVMGSGVGVIAVCKGAEIALAMATFLKKVIATVCINGPNGINGNSLRYRNLYIRGMPYITEGIHFTSTGAMEFHNAIEDPREERNQDCILPVENAQGPILFIVGGEDGNYNSRMFAEEALKRMKRCGKKNAKLLLYPGAGHLIEPPGSPFCLMSYNPLVLGPLMWGGKLEAHSYAQEHSWREIQKFFHYHLGQSKVSKL